MTSFSSRLARLWPYFAPGRWGFVLALFGALVAAATEPMIPALMQPLLDQGFQGRQLPLWMVPVTIIGLFALRGLAGFAGQYGLAWAANRGTLALRTAMFRRLMDAHAGLFTRHSASALTNTVVYEVQTGATQLVNSLQTLVRDSLTLLALLGYLMWLNWQLTLFVAFLFPAVAWVMRTLSRRLHRLTVEGQRATDTLAYVVEENVLAWRIVRLHGAQDQQAQRFDRSSQQLRRLALKSVIAQAAMNPMTQILAATGLSAVVVAALWQSSSSGSSVGSFVAFVTAMLMLMSPIKHLSDVAGPITRGLAALERAIGLIEGAPPEADGHYRPESGHRLQGPLVFEQVQVQYRADQAPALDGIDFVVPQGEVVALVGPSGAGKSTLVHLLPKFVDPTGGRILLDGHALDEWDTPALRRQLALVSQDVVLFNESIAANVALGDEIDMPRVREALRNANLLDFAEGLPQGLDTLVGHNGSQLSGGQRQRLAIARAIYKDAPILILDEATSALDSESERLVQDALDRLMRGRTTLVIAHRLSTIERADRIVVMDAGRIVEQGSHAALIAAGGLYARLHALQFKS